MLRLSRICYDITRQATAAESLQKDDNLLDILDQRAELLARISDIGQGLETKVQDDRKTLTAIPPQQEEAVNNLIMELNQVMGLIRQADQELSSLLRGELGELGAVLAKLRRGHTALKRYAPYQISQPRCIDRKD